MNLMIMEGIARKEASGGRRKVAAQSYRHRLNPAARPTRHDLCSRHHLLLFAFFIIYFLPICSASVLVKREMVEEPTALREAVSTPRRSSVDQWTQPESGKILVDLSHPPNQQEWTLSDVNDDLQRRQELGQDAPKSPSVTQTVTATVGGSGTRTNPSTTLVTAATDVPSPLPSAFDSGFGSNITASCASFMSYMLQNATFKACVPVSILLQNSMSFFQAEKSVTRITQVLDNACAANATECGRVMSAFASNITTSSACAADISTQNPLINQAHLGLLAYKPTYTATCLKNQISKSYCFAEAITNATNPADTYQYYLPLNITLPGGSQPTCNSCLQNSMAVYAAATADRSSALASTYVGAAMQVNVNCGPNFVNASLAAAVANSGASSPLMGTNFGLLAVVLAVSSLLL
ncbi:hypothetical protein HYFRA_00007333 [Hymenoscyphus fraxineus]|uniref:DUF7729 domain-containing protein n=1 Tax=Hymenoscyphus fraxineus TaxID=746836 RepID=A0A9N9KRK5_9HELO|nr:hypothetical protein HYFRA_00007333 [Hymenoscyphus fraxineus]